MRLTDQEIVEKSESTGNSDKALMDCFDMAAWARDFYENQICETCANRNNIKSPTSTYRCKKYLLMVDFEWGCKGWDKRNETE